MHMICTSHEFTAGTNGTNTFGGAFSVFIGPYVYAISSSFQFKSVGAVSMAVGLLVTQHVAVYANSLSIFNAATRTTTTIGKSMYLRGAWPMMFVQVDRMVPMLMVERFAYTSAATCMVRATVLPLIAAMSCYQ